MPRSETPLRSDLFPEISPYASGMLAVDGRHTIYWEQSGNPEGVPVLFLHGGPGAGSAPVHRRFFDPQFYRIIVFDQRGCGRSIPLGDLHDMRTVFPEAWRDFSDHLPTGERADLLGNYYRRLIDRNPDVHRPAARAWSRYEAACSTLYPTARAPFESDHGGFALALSRIEAHYFANGTFVPEGWPWSDLDRIRHLPCTIVQGRYDMVCP